MLELAARLTWAPYVVVCGIDRTPSGGHRTVFPIWNPEQFRREQPGPIFGYFRLKLGRILWFVEADRTPGEVTHKVQL